MNRHGQVAMRGWVESEEDWNKLPLQDDEVLVQVKAIGLKDRDFIMAEGNLYGHDLGTECAGLI